MKLISGKYWTLFYSERVKALIFNSQVAELQIRAALLNRFTQLGTHDNRGHALNSSCDLGKG